MRGSSTGAGRLVGVRWLGGGSSGVGGSSKHEVGVECVGWGEWVGWVGGGGGGGE